MAVKAIIFDMDGVLTDSEPLINAAAVAMFRERSLIVQPEDFLPFVGRGENRYIGGVAEKYGFALDIELAKKRTYEIYLDLVPRQLRAFPGAQELVRSCQQAGLRTAVASSADLIKIEANLRQIALPPSQRGFVGDEIEAVMGASRRGLVPLDLRRRLEALRAVRASSDFEALAVLFKRVKNIAREISPQPLDQYANAVDRRLLTEPAEQQLLQDVDARAPAIRAALGARDYRSAMTEAAALRPAVDRFFTEVFVMVDGERLRTPRLMLMVDLRDLILRIADISQLAPGSTS